MSWAESDKAEKKSIEKKINFRIMGLGISEVSKIGKIEMKRSKLTLKYGFRSAKGCKKKTGNACLFYVINYACSFFTNHSA